MRFMHCTATTTLWQQTRLAVASLVMQRTKYGWCSLTDRYTVASQRLINK